MNIQRKWLALAAVVMLLAAGGARANTPDARFFGGVRDGYDLGALNQSGLEWAEFQALLAARGRGGSRDGYALASRGSIFEALAKPPFRRSGRSPTLQKSMEYGCFYNWRDDLRVVRRKFCKSIIHVPVGAWGRLQTADDNVACCCRAMFLRRSSSCSYRRRPPAPAGGHWSRRSPAGRRKPRSKTGTCHGVSPEIP